MDKLNWLASAFRYRGTPREQLDTLEVVLQGTVKALYAQVQRIVALKEPWDNNLSFQVSQVRIKHMHIRSKVQTRVVITDAAGWWAVAVIDEKTFLLHSADGLPPKRIPTWQKLHTQFGLGKGVGMHFEASLVDGAQWSADNHLINLQHPMLWLLGRVKESSVSGL